MHIGILGPGRLGRTLAQLLAQAGHTVDLQGRGGVPAGDVVLLTVPDRSIGEAARSVPQGRCVLHCSGSTDIAPLRPHDPAGSFHPLMTFPGPDIAIPDLQGVPAALAGDVEAIEMGRAIAKALGMRAVEVPGDRRLYHAAAVMAGNFGTVLLADAARVAAAAGLPADQAADLLAPLALASLHNARHDPAAALTGPAARGDEAVIAQHRQALSDAGLHDLLRLYDILTERAQHLVDGG